MCGLYVYILREIHCEYLFSSITNNFCRLLSTLSSFFSIQFTSKILKLLSELILSLLGCLLYANLALLLEMLNHLIDFETNETNVLVFYRYVDNKCFIIFFFFQLNFLFLKTNTFLNNLNLLIQLLLWQDKNEIS